MTTSSTPHSWIQEVRTRLERPHPKRLPPSEDRQAAVLVPLYVDSGELWTVLTRKSEELRNHRGQVAFPGGSLEPGEDLWQAAVREAEEEVALDSKTVLPLGMLDELPSISGFRVVPCVGAVPFPLDLQADRSEVDEVFSVPLSACADPQWVEERQVTVNGRDRWVRVYHVGRHQIWGLTARVIENLLERLGLVVPTEISVN